MLDVEVVELRLVPDPVWFDDRNDPRFLRILAKNLENNEDRRNLSEAKQQHNHPFTMSLHCLRDSVYKKGSNTKLRSSSLETCTSTQALTHTPVRLHMIRIYKNNIKNNC